MKEGYGLLSRCRGELMGLALLWILLFHTYALAPIPIFGVEWVKSMGFLGVDVFLFLSALGLSLSLSRRKQSLRGFYLRRVVRVLPTYWLAVGGYGLILRAVGRTRLKTVLWNLSTLYYWFHVPDTFNWYVPALLALYLLTPLLYRAVERCPVREVLPFGMWCFALPFSTWLGFQGLGYINDFIYRLPIFWLGLLVGWYLAQGRALTKKRAAKWLVLAALSPLPAWFFPKMGVYFPPALVFTAVCVPLCLLTAKGLTYLKDSGAVRKALRLLGESSLEIYLLNVIFVLEYGFFSGFLDIGRGGVFYYAVTTAVDIGLGIALHKLLTPMMDRLSKRVTD